MMWKKLRAHYVINPEALMKNTKFTLLGFNKRFFFVTNLIFGDQLFKYKN